MVNGMPGRFFPRVIGVYIRNENFWRETQYKVDVKQTSICNVGFVSDGTGRLQVDGQVYALEPGMLFHFCRNHRMIMSSSTVSPLEYISVHYDYKWLSWEGNELNISAGADRDLPVEYVWDVRFAEVGKDMERIYQIWSTKNPGYEWRTNDIFRMLIDKLLQLAHTEHIKQDDMYIAIHASMEFIKRHFQQRIERNELAAMTAIAPGYYSVLFKRYTGYTLTEYILKLRMDQAKIMLRTTKEPIAKIAREVGYSDPLYFSRLFARETGLSPSSYRST